MELGDQQNIKGLSKKELVALVTGLSKNKKYGLVWEDKPEDVADFCKEKVPVLLPYEKWDIKQDSTFPTSFLIKGDNYHALSVLNFTHQNKIDLIYIDPPYNTGNQDFVYNDRFVDKADSYRHSKWLSFISKRLFLARPLLKETGVIFVSIDDNEISQLRLLLDQIFGEANFVACLPTIMNLKGNQDEFGFAGTHEYTLVYAKNIKKASFNEFQIEDEEFDKWESDDLGFYKKGAALKATGTNAPREKRRNLFYPIFVTPKNKVYVTDNNKKINKKDSVLWPITSGKQMSWRWQKETVKNQTYDIIVERNKGITLYKKQRPSINDLPSKKAKSLFYRAEYSSGNGTALLKRMFGAKIFNNPKPLQLIQDLVFLGMKKDGIVLDFTAGSGTTGHAVLSLNSFDGGSRSFILCTNNENEICDRVCFPRLKMAFRGYSDKVDKVKVDGNKGNLKCFITDFADSGDNDKNKKLLTRKLTASLMLKENVFDLLYKNKKFEFYKTNNKTIGIVYDNSSIHQVHSLCKKLNSKISLYIFSLGEETFDEEFEDLKTNVSIQPIPESYLRVYRRIFSL